METVRTKYGTVEQFLETELPYLHNAHVGKKVKCFAVAAVADTEIQTGDDGIPRRVPAHDFSSKGLAPLITWLAAAVVNDISNQPLTPPPQPPQPQPPEVSLWKTEIGQFFVGFVLPVVIVVIMFFVGRQGCAPDPPPRKTEPLPVLVEKWTWDNCKKAMFDCWSHWAEAKVTIRNDGAAGNITVTFTVHGKSKSKTVFFNQKEVNTITIKLELDRHPNFDTDSTGAINFKAAGK